MFSLLLCCVIYISLYSLALYISLNLLQINFVLGSGILNPCFLVEPTWGSYIVKDINDLWLILIIISIFYVLMWVLLKCTR
ncbi:hypothetical protein Lalb_Chr19g0135471 [Lupinus albus]|uniref:Uncharacterized protein n=1 Tax=Lupinus albus TaxID=3870 RepID=A0A6A4NLQ9_LUPAL|nr:hypothetical protein Lalb_Chr19g0135471 [Lupinus albus]